MSKNQPIDDETLASVLRAIEAAWEAGNPVASRPAETAHIAIRRWRSSRRRRVDQDSYSARVDDLAWGLATKTTPKKLVGPLIEDYRDLSQRIAQVLLADDNGDQLSSQGTP
jgi:hypothetical protein